MIRYIPKLDSELWSRKSLCYFENIDDMKRFVSDTASLFFRFIGNPGKHFCSVDVELKNLGCRNLMGMDRSVILNGKIVGYCGE